MNYGYSIFFIDTFSIIASIDLNSRYHILFYLFEIKIEQMVFLYVSLKILFHFYLI